MTYFDVVNHPSYSGNFFESPEIVNCTLDGMPVIDAAYSNKLNSQVTWHAKVHGQVDIGTGILPKVVKLSCGSWTSMPLVVMSATYDPIPATTNMTGTDIYSYRLSALNQSIPSFLNGTGATILSSIGSKVNVPIYGGPTWPIEQFEVQVGGVISEYLHRICKDFAYNYYIDNDGVHVFQGSTGDVPAVSHVVSMSHNRNIRDLKTRLFLKKKSKYTSKYEVKWDKTGMYSGTFSGPTDISTIRYIENGIVGHVGYIAFFQGNALAGYSVLDAASTPPFPPLAAGSWADNFTFDVVPNPAPFDTAQPKGTLTLFARPYNLNSIYDVTFEVGYPTYSSAWVIQPSTNALYNPDLNFIEIDPKDKLLYVISDKKLVVESSLWANAAVANAVKTYMFQDVNRSCDGYHVTCAIRPDLVPGGKTMITTDFMTAKGRIEGVSWSYGGGAPSTTLELSDIDAILQDASDIDNANLV